MPEPEEDQAARAARAARLRKRIARRKAALSGEPVADAEPEPYTPQGNLDEIDWRMREIDRRKEQSE
jgi:hypothetical protein